MLTALGITSLFVVEPERDHVTRAIARTATTQADDPVVRAATSTTTVSSTSSPGTTTTSFAAAPSPCAGVTKHGPPPPDQSVFFEPPERKVTAQRRVLAMGSWQQYSWRLSIERDGTYPRWNLAFDDAHPNGGSGGATDPTPPPLFVSGNSLGHDGWAYFGKARHDSACVVITTKSGARVVTDQFSRDREFDDGVFFVAILACTEGVRGVSAESYDAAGRRTGADEIEALPTGVNGRETPEDWCRPTRDP